MKDDAIEYVYYVYSNYDIARDEIVNKRLIFLPGITIAHTMETLENNLGLVSFLLTHSARQRFKNEDIIFDFSCQQLTHLDTKKMLAEMLGVELH